LHQSIGLTSLGINYYGDARGNKRMENGFFESSFPPNAVSLTLHFGSPTASQILPKRQSRTQSDVLDDINDNVIFA
jgi:hypothetical protein